MKLLEKAISLALKHNSVLISEEMTHRDEKLIWECSEGHRWEDTYGYMRTAFRCKECMIQKKSKERIALANKMAAEHNGMCLSTEMLSSKEDNLEWKCEKNHIWTSHFYSVKNGSWCPTCAIKGRGPNSKKWTIESLQKLAESRGGNMLSSEYIDQYLHLIWECEHGHQWNAALNDVRNGSWCPLCRKVSLEQVQEAAAVHNGKCLTTSWKNVRDKLLWECENGHQFTKLYNEVKSGFWCQECKRDEYFRNAQRKAIEFGGKCLSEKYEHSDVKLRWECEHGHTWESRYHSVMSGHWCYVCSRKNAKRRENMKPRFTIQDMNQVAAKYDGKCLSEEYHNAREKLKWQCAHGHVFERSLNHIRRKRWCSECKKMNRIHEQLQIEIDSPRKLKFTIEDMQNFAEQHGGECLSKEYLGQRNKLTWKCAKGHTWERSLNETRRGYWCTTCKKEEKKKLISKSI
ncbi:hypothetical protein [Bacillus thuringiensis]|uniref:hypothetical protein n=1 Tax=Bacillus thuringiensis TaxID=1428 RepID=UPI0021D685B4|nr:hypothetical protein [Bacillus thuringiensis]MCU7667489.1 hypothetical protein [Bacillus thuringiensis]